MIRRTVALFLLTFCSVGCTYTHERGDGAIFMKHVVHQIQLEKDLYAKLAEILPKSLPKQEALNILSSYDTALMSLFELAIRLHTKEDLKCDTQFLALNNIYKNHMRNIGGGDAREGWHEVGSYFEKLLRKDDQ